MKVLVTGGAGFIGSHVVEALAEAGHEVVVLDLLLDTAHGPGSTCDPRVTALAEVVHGDVREAATVARVLAGVDVVCHQAAVVGMGVDAADAPLFASHNDVGTAVLLAQMAHAGVRRLVLAGSMVVYGEGAYRCTHHGPTAAPPRHEEDLRAGAFEPRCPDCGLELEWQEVTEAAPLDPRTLYAATKAAQEYLVSAWARITGSQATVLRYHNVYGPHMPADTPYSGVAAIFRSSLARGRSPQVFEDGGQLRDFVHVRDVAQANRLAVEAGGTGVFNIGSGRASSVGEMAEELARACAGPAPVRTGAYRLGDVRHVVASSARAAAELGYAAGVGLAEGLAEFASAPLRTRVETTATPTTNAATP